MYYTGIELPPDCFCIVQSAEIPADGEPLRALCFLCLGEPPDGRGLDAPALIVVKHSYSIGEVYNRVQQIYQELHEWDENLRRILKHSGSIQEMLDISSQVFQNTLIMTDEENNIVSMSSIGFPGEGQEIENRLIDQDAFRNQVASLQRISSACYTVELRETWGLDESFVAMFLSILNDQVLLGTLALLPSCRPLGEHDHQILIRLGEYLKEAYLHTFLAKKKRVTECYVGLLSGESASEESISLLGTACNKEDQDQMRCIVITLPPQVTESYYVVLTNRFHEVVPNAVSTVYEGNFVVLVNATKSGLNKKRLRGWLNASLGEGVRAGIGDAFSNLEDLRVHYLESVAAHGFADTNKIKEFVECRLDYALSNCCGYLPASSLYPDGLHRLLELNRTSTVDYIETLRVWLEEGLNDSRTANRLFVRRNSFLSRRERLLATLGIDIKDPDARFHLSLCLRLLAASTSKKKHLVDNV